MMYKKIVVFLILVAAALTMDLLRQEVFAWMAPAVKQRAVSPSPGDMTSPNAVPGITSAARAAALSAPYPPPPGRANQILFLPAISNSAVQ